MSYTVKISPNKSIGKVVYIVEGQRKELTLLGHIFEKVLGYTTIITPRDKTPYIKYENPSNKNSQVFLISAKNSNISFINNNSGKEYLDTVFSTLYENYGLDLTNAATFYIFDRDAKSNKSAKFNELMPMLHNSRDNGVESNGLLLISYPCIEAYQKSCFDDVSKEVISSAKSLKSIVSQGQYQYDKISTEQLEKACVNMLVTISNLTDKELQLTDLDDFSTLNKSIFDEEERLISDKEYRLLSLLSISLLDLGILYFE